ncbi:hypothetical protein [Desulfosarcina sp.]|uniref:hypothetical protein n=1 Tax=Desulfosarcina sp. TaxID=2027861 RepID=UPI003970CFA8
MIEEKHFEIGEKYENMKGVFEVIAIRRDSMDIRWENGEEISTTIELQQRIIERMQHEKAMEEVQSSQDARKAKTSVSKSGKQFSGLEDGDFSDLVSKTVWRGRGQLGGAVAQRFKTKLFKFNSWAVLRRPEVNWLDVKRQKQENLPLQAKFYARVEEDFLVFGVHIPAPDPTGSGTSDWQALMTWLAKPENDAWLKKQCSSHDLCLYDSGVQGFSGTVETQKDQWVQRDSDKKEAGIDSLSAFLSDAGQSGALDLRIEKRLGKEVAIEKKQNIAGDLVALFETLMPLYAAAASHKA